MLSTPCELCCFAEREKRGCRAGQYCIVAGETFAAPGFCRLYRTPAWMQRQHENGVKPGDLGELIYRATIESDLRYDLMVLYDERVHSPEMLRLTLSTMDLAESSIVVNTGADRRQGTAVAVAREFEKPYQVEQILDPTIVGPQAIDEAVRLVKQPYFIVIEAGRRIMGLAKVKLGLSNTHSRAVYWHFPLYVGKTAMAAPRTGMGLYLTAAYNRLGGNREKPFWEKLNEYEDKTGWSLSWLCERGALV